MKNQVINYALSLLFTLGIIGVSYSQCDVQAYASEVDVLCGTEVRLSAQGEGVTVFENDFNGCSIGTGWDATFSAQFNDPCGVSKDGTCYLWMGSNADVPRAATTGAIDLSTGGTICFDMRYGAQGDASPCEGIEKPNEGVYLEYRVGAGPWTEIAYFDPNGGNDPQRTNWNRYCEAIPAGAQFPNVQIRWIQKNSDGIRNDHWGLEDVVVEVNPPGVEYTWQHTGVAKSTGDTDPVTPTTNTTYTVEYKFGGCVSTSSVNVRVVKPTITATKNPSIPVCPGQPVQLDVINSYKAKIPDNCGLTPNLACSAISEQGGEIQIGNGTITEIGALNSEEIFGDAFDAQTRTQIIYRAAELKAQGFNGGKITSIQLQLDGYDQAYSVPNLEIKIGCTNQSQFTSNTWITGLNTVYSTTNYPLTIGWMNFPMSQAFEWDGTSNIVIEICSYPPAGWDWIDYPAGPGAETANHNPGFASMLLATPDASSGTCAFPNQTFMAAGDRNIRPNTKFGFCEPREIAWEFTWTPDVDLTNNQIQNPVSNPAITRNYTVTMNGPGFPAGCAVEDDITVQVSNIANFNPTANEVCEGEELRLDAGINGMTTYSWIGPNGFTANGKTPTRAGMTVNDAGTYEVTVDNGSCTETKTVEVVVGVQPIPGGTYSIDICSSETAFDLEANVGNPKDADPTWTSTGSPNGTSGISGTTLDASVLPTIPGDYTFTRSVTNDCGTQSVDVQINVKEQLSAGNDGDITACNSSTTPVNLFNQLEKDDDGNDPTPGGTWTAVTAGLGAEFNAAAGTFVPDGMAPQDYVFEYAVDSDAPCEDRTARVTVVVIANPVTGTTGTTKVCTDGASTVDLFTVLTPPYDAGGDWSAVSALVGGASVSGSTFDPGNAPANTYTFKYEINTDGCPVTSTNVTVEVVNLPNPGEGVDGEVCNSEGVIDLTDYLSSSPQTGGTWTELTSLAGADFDAAAGTVDVTNHGGEDLEFQYEVAGNAPCGSEFTSFVLKVSGKLSAGNDVKDTICTDLSNVDLNTFLDGADLGGTWAEVSASGGVLNPNGTYNSSGVTAGEYTFEYTTDPPANCPTETSQLNLYVRDFPIFSSVAPPMCSADRTTYDVQLTVSGGDPATYAINQPGAFVSSPPNTFQSDDIPSNIEVTFEVTDQYGCGIGDATVKRNCDCKTEAGAIMVVDTAFCDATTAVFDYLGGFNNDSNDTYQFILYDGIGGGFGTILERSKTPEFTFNLANGYQFDVTYFVAVVAGDSTTSGDVILTDACLSASQPAKVIWHPLPQATVSVDPIVICPGDVTEFEFSFSVGTAPFQIAFNEGAANDTIKNLTAANNDHTTAPITADVTYNFVSVIDRFGCASNLNVSQAIDVNQASLVELNAPDSICLDATATGAMSVRIDGPGTQYEVTYTNLNTGVQFVESNLPKGSSVSIGGLLGDANAAVQYRLDTITGNASSICPAVTTGIFTITPVPTVSADASPASDAFCEADANVLVDVDLTGIGPWEVTINGSLVINLSSRDNNGVAIPNPGPGNYTYSITAVDLGGSLECQSTTNSFDFVVNETPEITATFDVAGPVVCQDGAPQLVNFAVTRGTVENYTITGFSIGNGSASSTQSVTRSGGGSFNIPQPVNPGSYVLTGTVSETNAPQCAGNFIGSSIDVKALPTVSYNSTDAQFTDTVCLGAVATLVFDVTADVAIDPTNTVSFIIQGSDGSYKDTTLSPGRHLVNLVPLQSGEVTFTVTGVSDDIAPSCNGDNSSTLVVQVLDAPTIELTESTIEVCEGTPVAIPFEVTGTGNILGVLSQTGTSPANENINQPAGMHDITLDLEPGFYNFSVGGVSDQTVAQCAGEGLEGTAVTVRALPNGTAQVFQEVCEGELTTLTLEPPKANFVNATQPFYYVVQGWSDSGADTTVTVGFSNVELSKVRPVPGGTVIINRVYDSSNPLGGGACEFDPEITLPYIVNELPRANIYGEDVVCVGETPEVRLNVSAGVGSHYEIILHELPKGTGEDYEEVVVKGENVVALDPIPLASRSYSLERIEDLTTGCFLEYETSADATVIVNPRPSVSFTSDIQASCPPLNMALVQEVSANDGIADVFWTFGDGTTAPASDTVFKTFENTGVYDVTLTAVSINDCETVLLEEGYAEVYSMPQPAFVLKEPRVTMYSPEVKIRNFSENVAEYHWDFGGFGTSDDFEPRYYLNEIENGFVDICLTATTSNGCVDTVCEVIEVVGALLLYVPNTFTPEGDGFNDVFLPVFSGELPETYDLTIYTRWGNQVFHTTDPLQGWDGVGPTKVECEDGVYVYKISLTGRYDGKKVTKAGTLNLYR